MVLAWLLGHVMALNRSGKSQSAQKLAAVT